MKEKPNTTGSENVFVFGKDLGFLVGAEVLGAVK
jgi:hypothetical protein